MNISLLFALALFLVIGASTHASTNVQTRPLSLPDCIQLALRHNLQIQITRYEPEIARRELRIATSAYEPTLNLSQRHSYDAVPGGLDEQNRPYPGTTSTADSYSGTIASVLPLGTSVQVGSDFSSTVGQGVVLPFENANGALGVSLRQPLLKNLWIDSTRLNIQLSRKQIKASELELRQEIMSIATQVEVAYYDLFQARQNVKVQELAVALAERHVTDSEKRVAAGRQARFEKNQAEAQVSSSKASLLAAQGATASAEFRLKGLLSDNFHDWEDVHIELSTSLLAPQHTFDVGETLAKGLTFRPDFLRAKVQLEREGLTLKYSRNQLYPQVDLVASYGQMGTGRGFGDAWDQIKGGDKWGYSIGGVLIIPLGNRGARESYASRKAIQEQSLLRFKKLEQDIIIQIRDSVQQAQIAFARVDATKQARVAAEAALQAEQKRFENGQSTSFVLLQVQNALTQARVGELSTLAGYNIALAQLALQEGTTLERHNINLKIE